MDGLLEDGVVLLPGGLSRGVAVRTRDGRVTSPSSMEEERSQDGPKQN